MTLTVLLVILGLTLVVLGSDWLVDGATGIARRFRVSEFVIGLTIVGFGTSCPELVVSLTGAFEGSADISIGNVVGSNIFNTLLILGLTSVLMPVVMTDQNRRRDIPISIGVTALLLAAYFIGVLQWWGGLVFLAVFAAYLINCFKGDSREPSPHEDASPDSPLPKSILFTLAGLAGLIVGGKLFVDNSVEVARALGVSEKFIAVTLLAGGTSLPELATCIAAAIKGKGQMALGNILGSNVFNILLILGCSALVHPLSFNGMSAVDMTVLGLSSVLVATSACTGKKNLIDRFDGILMLALEASYIVYLSINA